jgi:hypothetical protein
MAEASVRTVKSMALPLESAACAMPAPALMSAVAAISIAVLRTDMPNI